MGYFRCFTILSLLAAVYLTTWSSKPYHTPVHAEATLSNADLLHADVQSLVARFRRGMEQTDSPLQRIRRASHAPAIAADISQRLANLEFPSRGPTLLFFDTHSSRRSLSDVIASAAYFRQILNDPYSTLSQRTDAIASLAFLPQQDFFFDDHARQAWRNAVLMTGDDSERTLLMNAYSKIPPQPADIPMVREIATSSALPNTRAMAVKALGYALEESADDSLRDLIVWIRDHDEAPRVVHFAKEALR